MLALGLAGAALAEGPGEQVIDLGVEDLGGGFTRRTTLTITGGNARSGLITGTRASDYYSGSSWVGSVALTGTFSYNGSTATALSASASHSTAPGWSYGPESVWCSGPTAYCMSSFTGSGGRVGVSLALTCSPGGAIS